MPICCVNFVRGHLVLTFNLIAIVLTQLLWKSRQTFFIQKLSEVFQASRGSCRMLTETAKGLIQQHTLLSSGTAPGQAATCPVL